MSDAGLAAMSGGVGPLVVGASVVGLVLAAMAAWACYRPRMAAPGGDEPAAELPPRQEPGSATTVER